jgi:hypothetical protein
VAREPGVPLSERTPSKALDAAAVAFATVYLFVVLLSAEAAVQWYRDVYIAGPPLNVDWAPLL